jgi:ATP-dependent helicase/nuclease subunit A
MNRPISVPEITRSSQHRAADPRYSIWVSANAGSGKTHVLTLRVLRLLLSGVAPESILCLTYTKAAAAEMRRRVSAHLARWALMEESELDGELFGLEGQAPGPAMRTRARALFAHALETPGGLKIVTIHAFCESVLHRFPLEAQVPFDFSVIEEAEQAGMILAAREAVLAGGLNGNPALVGPVTKLFELMSDHAITDAIGTALADSRKLRPILLDRAGAKKRLRQLIGAGADETSLEILEEIVTGRLAGPLEYGRILEITPSKGGSQFEDKLARLDPQNPAPKSLLQAFLTAEGAVPKRFPKKAVTDTDPALADLLVTEAERLEGLGQKLVKAALIERSEALLDVLGAIADRYEAQKRALSLLDFDDLIERLGDLFANRTHSDWVKYKLDAGITHILVDESQDTNPEQWRVVREIADEFFVGDSAVDRPRTLFAVGDEKQSIYSFQGADPALFGEERRAFQAKARAAGKSVELVLLHTSFRSLRGILAAVDAVFKRQDLQSALLSPDAIAHDTAITEPGGAVTLWPPIQQEAETADEADWPLTAPDAEKSAPRQVAERIAGEVARWVREKRPLGQRGRPVSPNDVLILVQSRNALFQELIRALLKERLPTPGADRLAVTTHIGVLDLLALGDVLLNIDDDLQLAALLRSPLFDICEDDLFRLAQGRGGSLWDALGHADFPAARQAYEQLHRWRGRLDFERPYEFFAEILYVEQGLKRFHARLGTEIDDVFAQFLDMALAHEQTSQPSLQGFLSALRASAVSIKRELAETGSGVRVMTVHGAKGLEAPIVILADAASKPDASRLRKPVYIVPHAPGPLLIHASARKDHVLQTEKFRDDDEGNQKDEYWRKLYVGMTRAEDELYVTGTLTKDGKLDGTWYEAIDAALRPASEIVMNADGAETALIYPHQRPSPLAVSDAVDSVAAATASLDLAPLPPLRIVPVVSPSSAFVAADPLQVYDTALDASVDAEAARKEGLALHALLQHLGKVERSVWPMVVDKAMPVLLPDDVARHALLAEKARRILDNPEFSHLFGAQSRAEVPFLANARRNDTSIRLAGRIDRLVVTGTEVLVVDYKSDAYVPGTSEDVPPAYLTQLGLYALVATQLFPAHTVAAAILWTTMESLMILPPAKLRQATAAFTME